jgi:hypothetical protein
MLFQSPNFNFFPGGMPPDPPITWVNLVNRSSKTLDPPLHKIIATTPEFFAPPREKYENQPLIPK